MGPPQTQNRRLPTPLALGALIALHFVVVGLFAFSVIPQQFHPPDQLFWFHNGGDNAAYFELAQSLLQGEVVASKYPLGFPITLIPFIAITQPASQEDLIEPVAAFWSLVMFPLAQLALYRLTRLMTGHRTVALLAVLIWTLLPLGMWLGVSLVAAPPAAETSAVHLIWAQMLSDGPATLLTIVAFLLYAELRRHDSRPRLWVRSATLGLTLGALILVRYTGALSAGPILLLLVIERRWAGLVVASLLMAGVASIQLVYNAAFFGSPFTSGYTVLDILPERGLFHPGYLTDAVAKLMQRSVLVTAACGAAALAGMIGGLWATWKLNRWSTVILTAWIVPYAVFYALYYYSWTGSLLRFLMPIYPALAIAAAALLFELRDFARSRSR